MTIWVFDYNYRNYTDEAGVKHSAPIYKDHWRPYEVASETTRSYVLTNGTKVPKKNPPKHAYAFSEEEVEQNVYINDNAYEISERIRSLDYSTLKAVAQIIRYERYKEIMIPRELNYTTTTTIETYDLNNLFSYALIVPFELPAKIKLYAAVMGENDDAGWYWIFSHEGTYYYAEGGCDYTGWDCQSWGDIKRADNIEDAILMAPEKEPYYLRPIREYLRNMVEGNWQIGVIEAS